VLQQKSRFFCAFLASFILIYGLPLSVFALTKSDSNNLRAHEDKVLHKLDEVSDLEKREEDILLELVAIQSNIERLEKLIPQLDADLFLAEEELKPLNESLNEVRLRLKEKSEILDEKVKSIYTLGEINPFHFVFSADSFQELYNNLTYLNSLANKDAELVESILEEEEVLNTLKESVEAKKDKIILLKEEIQNEKESLKQQFELKEELLVKVREDQKLSKEKLAEFEAELSSIMNKIGQIEMGVSRGTERTAILRMLATGYCSCPICTGSGSGITAIGLKAKRGVVAVDPSVVPLGTKLYVSGYGEAIAGDVGRKIKKNRIDLCFDNHQEALSWGKRWVIVKILD